MSTITYGKTKTNQKKQTCNTLRAEILQRWNMSSTTCGPRALWGECQGPLHTWNSEVLWVGSAPPRGRPVVNVHILDFCWVKLKNNNKQKNESPLPLTLTLTLTLTQSSCSQIPARWHHNRKAGRPSKNSSERKKKIKNLTFTWPR